MNKTILKGLYNEAIAFTNTVDEETRKQIIDVLNNEWMKDIKIRIMPDVHFGYGVPVGFTQNILDKIVPTFVGVDIGCGMLTTKISNDPSFPINFEKLDKSIKEFIPSGFNIFDKQQNYDINDFNLSKLIAKVNIDRALKSIGTLGGGNHFIEINQSDQGIYLVIHSGSRHLGVEVCNYWSSKIDPSLGYLTGKDFDGYIHDMEITQKFASLNRISMRNNIVNKMKFNIISEFETIHNYIDMEDKILRKGAISAKKDEIVLIPINMKEGSVIAKGLGNENWNYSAPHGAGRIMSRTQAKKILNINDFKTQMKDVWTSSVSLSTIDESPKVYKNKKEIITNTKDTIEVLEHLKVLYNFKAK